MATKIDREAVFNYWNKQKIVVHRRINQDIETALNRTLKYYPVEEVFEFIDLYATILEIGVPEEKQKYFWTHKWNLYEFLIRGIKKFDGRDASQYLKQQTVQNSDALVFKRKK
jgi:hypothetical protein